MKTVVKNISKCMAGLLAFGISNLGMAQSSYVWDAMNFSQTFVPGTARMQGMAGAQNALGGEASAAANNPAGLGQLRKSHYTISPSFSLNSTSTTYNQSGNVTGIKTAVSIPNLSIVFAFPKSDLNTDKWRGGSFAISYNKTADFNRNFTFTGTNINGSMVDAFISAAKGTHSDVYLNQALNNQIKTLPSLAYACYIINPYYWQGDKNYIPLTDTSRSDPTQILSTNQNGYVNTKGRASQWDFAYGANYDDKILLGGSLSFVGINYTEDRYYNEDLFVNQPSITNFNFLQSRTVSGTGAKLSMGAQFIPVKFLRLGLSLTTPTIIGLKENFSEVTMNSYITGKVIPDAETGVLQNQTKSKTMGPGSNSYTLVSPAKISTGLALVGKMGLISADLDVIDYKGMSMTASGTAASSYSGDNQFINNNFNLAYNYRVGGELRLSDIYRLRAGYGIYGQPTSLQKISNVSNIALGGGYRDDDMFLDVSYNMMSYKLYDYQYNGSPAAIVNSKNSKVMVTVGLFF